MEDIIILGNSGAARECHQLLTDCIWGSQSLRYSWNFAGFLSFKGFTADLGSLTELFLGDLDSFDIRPQHRFIIGVGSPQLRKEAFAILKSRSAQFINLISPWSYVPADFRMGEANIINSTCNFSGGSSIGDANYFNGNVRLGHDINIGSFNFFAPSTTVLGGVRVGDCNTMAVQSTLLDHARVGSYNHISPGSIVYKGCRDHCRMSGNPALKIGNI